MLTKHTLSTDQVSTQLSKLRNDTLLTPDLQARLRDRIMQQTKPVPVSFVERIRTLARETVPATSFRALLKEKLITIAEYDLIRRGSSSLANRLFGFIKGHRRLTAGVMALLLMSTVIFNATLSIPYTEASFFTVIEDVQGEVYIIREGQSIPAVKGYLLKANDVLKTGLASKAAVQFLDQSVSRLDENTEIKISQLSVNPSNKTQTIIELILTQGRLWTRVVNLVDNVSRFQVKAANTVTTAKRRAAFDVSLSERGHANVAALHNRVDIAVASQNKVIETTLVKGYSAIVKPSAPLVTNIVLADSRSEEGDKIWIASNLTQDQVYIASVKEQAQEAFRQQANSSSDIGQFSLTRSDFDRNLQTIENAKKQLAEAEVLLEKGDKESSDKRLAEFNESIQAVVAWANEHESTNAEEVLQIKTTLREVLASYQKQLTLILPTDPAYPIKDSISQAIIAVADDSAGRAQQKLEVASNKLLEAHDLVEQGNTVLAQQQVEEYSQAIQEVVTDVKNLPDEEKEKAVSAILDTKLDDIKSLEVITALPTSVPVTPVAPLTEVPADAALEAGTSTPSVPASEVVAAPTAEEIVDSASLEKSVSDAKTEALTKLGEVVLEVQKSAAAPEVVEKLQDIKNIDVNGKAFINVQVTRNHVIIRTNSDTISVRGAALDVKAGTSTPALVVPTPPTKVPETPTVSPLPQKIPQ